MNLNSSTVTIVGSDTADANTSVWSQIKKRTRRVLSRYRRNTFVINEATSKTAKDSKGTKFSKKPSIEDDSNLYKKYAHVFRRKKRWELFILSSVVCGIEFVYSAMTAYVTPILLSLNLDVKFAMMIWCIGPTIGFFLTPILGSLSDKCNLKFGRRRPFIILLAFGILFGLIFIPHGKAIGKALGEKQPSWHQHNLTINREIDKDVAVEKTSLIYLSHESYMGQPQPWTIFFTVIGVIALDFCADACQSPSRTYLLDVTVPEDHSIGLSTFTIIAGIGGSIGYLIGGIDWQTTSFGHFLGGHISSVFTFITIFFVICLILTISSFSEIPLYILEDEQYSRDLQKVASIENWKKLQKKQKTSQTKIATETLSYNFKNSECVTVNSPEKLKTNEIKLNNDIKFDSKTEELKKGGTEKSVQNLATENCPETSEPICHSLSINHQCSSDSVKDISSGKDVVDTEIKINKNTQPPTLKQYFLSIIYMPKSLKILCLTKFLCAATLISYLLYFTDFVGESVFGGDPGQPEDSEMYQVYHDGVKFGSFAMALYSISCSCYSYSMEFLIRRFGIKPVFIGGPIICSIGLAVMALCRHKVAVILLSPTPGFMYATIFILPYLLVSNYHSKQQFEEKAVTEDTTNSSNSSPVRGIGTDVAIVDSMVFISQILLSLCMGSLVKLAGSSAVPIYAASFFSACSAICATQVFYLDL